MLLMICLAKFAGAQSPGRSSYQHLHTTTASSIANNTTRTHGTDAVSLATIKALSARTEKLQAENQALKGQLMALQVQGETDGGPSRQELKESTAKVMFIVCLMAGLLLMALVSGRVFSRDTYAGRFNFHNW
jgi:hypothetical protein